MGEVAGEGEVGQGLKLVFFDLDEVGKVQFGHGANDFDNDSVLVIFIKTKSLCPFENDVDTGPEWEEMENFID